MTTLRNMLDNPINRGVYRYEGRKADGSTETVEIEKPAWRIVDEALWKDPATGPRCSASLSWSPEGSRPR